MDHRSLKALYIKPYLSTVKNYPPPDTVPVFMSLGFGAGIYDFRKLDLTTL